MKRIISLIVSVVFLSGIFSCKDHGKKIPLLPLGSEEETASFLYLQYMYDNENGARLNEQATAGMHKSEDLNSKVNQYMGAPLVEYLGQSFENTDSPNWWEKLDIDSKGLTAYMNTREGGNAIKNYISSGEKAKSALGNKSFIPERRPVFDVIAAVVATALEIYKIYHDITVANSQTALLSQIDSNLSILMVWMFTMMKNTNDRLDQIQRELQNGFEQTNFKIIYLEGWLKEKDFRDAKIILESKCNEFSILEGVDAKYRRNIMKEFFVSQYESMYNLAFVSAVERTQLLNNRPPSPQYKKVPGNMLLSDVMFMRQMSEMRLTYSPVFYSGETLLKYRANAARKDLERLLVIKESLLSDQTPDRDPEYFEELCALLASWEIILRAHIEVYYGKDVQDIDLENASHLSNESTIGTFGDMDGNAATGTVGKVLSDASGQPLSSMFNAGDSLESVFDTGTDGDLAPGKSLRVVHRGKNLLSDLGLVPIVKRLINVNDMNSAPGKNQFYVDPSTGRFVLPRPSYWSVVDNVETILSPKMSTSGYTPSMHLGLLASFTGGKFSSCVVQPVILWANEFTYQTSIHPFGDVAVDFMNKGTTSFWWASTAAWQAFAGMRFYITDRICISAYHSALEGYTRVSIYQDHNTLLGAYNVLIPNAWNHVYVVWDDDSTMGGDTIQVFVNGNKILGSSVKIVGLPKCAYYLTAGCNIGGGASLIDNIKIWNHVVSHGSSAANWEYNNGKGRENALHEVYGPDDDPQYDYRPKLVENGGVGYYYLN